MKEAELTSYEKKHRINRETSSDQQCNEGSVEIKRRKQTDSRERKIVFKRERDLRERKFGFLKKPWEKEGFHRRKTKEKKPKKY